MLQEKSETKDKAQGGAPDNSADTQEKGVEFSENPKRPDGDEHKATQEQPKLLRRSVRVTEPPVWYGWEDDHVFIPLVTETGDPSS